MVEDATWIFVPIVAAVLVFAILWRLTEEGDSFGFELEFGRIFLWWERRR